MRHGNCPHRWRAADCGPVPWGPYVTLLAVSLLLVALAVSLAFGVRRHVQRRRHALARLLDAADALEDRLRLARSEIEAIAGDDHNPVREAMQEMLRQRLWLQQHGDAASLRQLDNVRGSIEAARGSIELQLLQIERARAPLH